MASIASSLASPPTAAPRRQLNDGRSIPTLGLGVYRVAPGNATYTAVRTAIASGYRLIDTAQAYMNERDVGKAVRDCGVARQELFISTKLSAVWISHQITYNRTFALLHASFRKLNMSYVDLYFIHSPRDVAHQREQWRALEDARSLGLVRSIGVSDYEVAQLERIMAFARVPPAVLQIELSPWLATVRAAELRYAAAHGIVVQAWGALATGRKFDEPHLQSVARRHGTKAANVLLAWSADQGAVAVLTSQNKRHLEENLAFVSTRHNFTLTLPDDAADFRALAASGPFYSDDMEDSGDAFSPIFTPLAWVHDSVLGLCERVSFIDATESFSVLGLGLLLWTLPLVAACVCCCCHCCCGQGGGLCQKRYTSTYAPPERKAKTFEFGKMELH